MASEILRSATNKGYSVTGLMRLVCRRSIRVRKFPSPGVQRLQRPSILCNARLVFFIRCQEPFCLQSISGNACEALFIKYVFEWYMWK